VWKTYFLNSSLEVTMFCHRIAQSIKLIKII
jgi:hypothetical protein